MKKLLLIVAVLLVQHIYAQIQDALVFLSDKENVATSIANPITILTQEAIDRKAMHGVAIDARDVPVNENYITQLKNTPGISIYAKTKWMNAVYVRGTQANIEDLLNEPFVSEVEFMDKSLNFPSPQPLQDKFLMETADNRIIYDYGTAANQIEMIAGDYLHEQDFTGDGMVIAVLDSGFPNVTSISAFSNMIAENRLKGTYDFVLRQTSIGGSSSHGTRVLSDMAGLLDGQFVGTAPEASYYLFRTEETASENPVEEAWWVEALERADSLGVDVVNTSLGYQDFDNSNYDHSYQDLDGNTTIAARGGNHAFDKGMLLVTSAGNDGGGFNFVATPADAIGILTVGAVDSSANYASFSSVGPTVDGRIKPDVMAQGQSAAVVNEFGEITTNSGTSFSSPIMAGVVASLWQARPEARNYQIMQLVRESAHLFSNPTDEMGYGIPNFEDAYNALLILGIEEELLVSQFAIYPNPVSDVLYVSFPKDIASAQLTVYNVLGAKVMEKKITVDNYNTNVSELTSGMYIAHIQSGHISNSFKFIKK